LCVEVLEEFASSVVLADGWEYSRGCLAEFTKAVQIGLPCFDQAGRTVTEHAASVRIELAVGCLDESDPLACYQRGALSALASL